MDRKVSQCVEGNYYHETWVICCVNILSAVHSLMSYSQAVPLASFGDGYYGVYDWWIERFHNVLRTISSTKLG